MMPKFRQPALAHFRSIREKLISQFRFARLAAGSDVTIAGFPARSVRVESIAPWRNHQKLNCFLPYTYRCAVLFDGTRHFGFGSAHTQDLAMKKATAEAFERGVFKTYSDRLGVRATTNGFAAHVDPISAKQNAMAEALERDAVLAHWLSGTGFQRLDPASFPVSVVKWVDALPCKDTLDFWAAVTTATATPALLCGLEDRRTGAFVCATSALRSVDGAFESALDELTRISSLAFRGVFQERINLNAEANAAKVDAIEHGLYYSYVGKRPAWFFAEGPLASNLTARTAQSATSYDQFFAVNMDRTLLLTNSPLYVAYANLPELQPLYFSFAHDKSALPLNRKRFDQLNLSIQTEITPHFIG